MSADLLGRRYDFDTSQALRRDLTYALRQLARYSDPMGRLDIPGEESSPGRGWGTRRRN